MACVLLAAARYKYPTPCGGDDGKVFGKSFNDCYRMFENRLVRQFADENKLGTITKNDFNAEARKKFDALPWAGKIDERIDPGDLMDCIKMIEAFYSKQMAPAPATDSK